MGAYSGYVEDYIDGTGEHVLTLPKYYEKEIATRGGKYTGHSLGFGVLAICPLHDDHDPSLGMIKGKKGVVLGHCFGCGWTGTVSAMHRRLMAIELGRSVSEEEACRDLCTKWGIPIWKGLSTNVEKKFEERMRSIDLGVKTGYTKKDYILELRNLRKTGRMEDAWKAYVKMVAVEKGLV